MELNIWLLVWTMFSLGKGPWINSIKVTFIKYKIIDFLKRWGYVDSLSRTGVNITKEDPTSPHQSRRSLSVKLI